MNRKLFNTTLLAAALGLTACADVTAPAATDVGAPEGTVTVGSLQMYLREPLPSGNAGWCSTDADDQPNGAWMKIEGSVTVIHLQSEHCTIRV